MRLMSKILTSGNEVIIQDMHHNIKHADELNFCLQFFGDGNLEKLNLHKNIRIPSIREGAL